MTEVEQSLNPSAAKRDFHWRMGTFRPGPDIWSQLAEKTAIPAAASTVDEEGERHKTAPKAEAILRAFAGGTILDVGCGYGHFAKHVLPQRSFTGYIGLDGSPTMLRFFWKRYQRSALERRTPLLLLHAPIDQIPLRDQSVDNVVFSGVLFHNPKHVARCTVEEIRRVLKPGGEVQSD